MAKIRTSILENELSGKSGNAVFVNSKFGVIVRSKPIINDPKTPAQLTARANMTRANEAFRQLTPEQSALWKAYAQKENHANSGEASASAQNSCSVFVRLATKLLQANPNAPIPMTPPLYSFAGNPITITAVGGDGQIVFSASGSNSADTQVQLLYQPLRFACQATSPRNYKTGRFAHFSEGSLSAPLSVPGGWYAPAYRFVNTSTGQSTPLSPLGVVWVG